MSVVTRLAVGPCAKRIVSDFKNWWTGVLAGREGGKSQLTDAIITLKARLAKIAIRA